MKLAAALLAGLAGGGIVAGVLLVVRPVTAPKGDSLQAPASDPTELSAAIARLDQRLARIEASLSVQDSRGTREPAASAPAPASSTAVPESLDGVHRDLLDLSKRIDLLAGSIRENHKPAFSIPTLEQVRGARKVLDWAYVDELRLACIADRNAAADRVRQLSFDELLRKVGVPTSISTEDGRWYYCRDQVDETGKMSWRGVFFLFVGDSVEFRLQRQLSETPPAPTIRCQPRNHRTTAVR